MNEDRAVRRRLSRILTSFTVCVLLCLACVTLAWAAWPDLPPGRLDPYGVSDEDIQAISQGFTDGRWRPDSPLSRAHFAKMVVRTFSLPAAHPSEATFSDVPVASPYFADIEAASAAGLIAGQGDGTFDPSGTITRQEAIAIVGRGLARSHGVVLADRYSEARAEEIVTGFADGADVPPSLVRAVAYAAEKGLTRGGPDGRLRPLDRITRLQGAVLLVRVDGIRHGEPRPYYPTTMFHTPNTGPGVATVSGTVTAEDGQNLFGFASLMDEHGSQLEWTYIEQGSSPETFAFRGLSPGDYRLAVYSPDYVSEFYGGLTAQDHEVAESELIHVGTEDVRADFVLAKARSISGRITWSGVPSSIWYVSDPAGGPDTPWIYFDVAVYNEAGNQVHFRYSETGEYYALWGLIPGVYTVKAHATTSGGSAVDAWYDGAHSMAEATRVDISGGDAIDTDLYLGVLRP